MASHHMKKLIISFMLVAVMLCSGCTRQSRTRSFGGTSRIELPAGQKLIEVTWKENNLWYLTEPMDEGYTPKDKTFHEDSEWGMMEGTVIFHEHK